MIKAEINPYEIYNFYPFAGVTLNLVERIKRNGWIGIPRVPVFEIAEEFKEEGEFNFVLADGAHRRNAAAYLGTPLPVAIYRPDDKILVKEHKLAPFSHSKDPRLYQKLIKFYQARKEQAEFLRNCS